MPEESSLTLQEPLIIPRVNPLVQSLSFTACHTSVHKKLVIGMY